jgi:A1 cistron-splicing factor AAR2
VIVRRWNSEEQLFEALPASDDAAYTEAVRNMDFDKYLGPYPIDNL